MSFERARSTVHSNYRRKVINIDCTSGEVAVWWMGGDDMGVYEGGYRWGWEIAGVSLGVHPSRPLFCDPTNLIIRTITFRFTLHVKPGFVSNGTSSSWMLTLSLQAKQFYGKHFLSAQAFLRIHPSDFTVFCQICALKNSLHHSCSIPCFFFIFIRFPFF